MEPQKHIPALDPINNELTKISFLPEFKAFCPRIWEIMDIIRDIYSLLGSKSLTQFDVPIRYIRNFLTRYNQELKHNADIATVMLTETIDTIYSYLTSLQKMAKEAPERPTSEQPKSSSWRPFKNLFSSSGSVNKATTCTIEHHGLGEIFQKAYSCQTCSLENEKMLCEGCATRCHSGHKVLLRGEVHGYCDCRYETTLCQLQEACTMNYSGRDLIAQQAFICETCKMDQSKGEMICHYCSENCHKGHTLTYLGMTGSGFCDCKDLFKFCHQHKRK